MITDETWPLRAVAWEMTRRCPLACRHCRADAGQEVGRSRELTTAEGVALIDDLAATYHGLLILTGGEPMLRDDFLVLARHAAGTGLRVVAAVCGTLLDPASITALGQAGVAAVSLSIDGSDAATHDGLRGRVGAFSAVCAAAGLLKAGGLPFQINTTVHRGNVSQLPALDRLVTDLGAATWDLFLLVPTGRGRGLAAAALAPDAYESVLRWAAVRAVATLPPLRVTCAPRFVPIAAECGGEGRSCLGGRSFAFVGADGTVQMCGFLPEAAGNVRDRPFSSIWRDSPLFASLRDRTRLRGVCGACSHRLTCGGCRARAAAAGDLLGADPCCILAADGEAGHGR